MGEVKNNMGNGEAKQLICMTHGHELKWGNVGGRGCAGWSGVKGWKWDNCHSIINKIMKKKPNSWTLIMVWAGTLVNLPSWSGQVHWKSLRKNSLKPNRTSHHKASWFTVTDGFLKHSPNRGSLYCLQKIIVAFFCVCPVHLNINTFLNRGHIYTHVYIGVRTVVSLFSCTHHLS